MYFKMKYAHAVYKIWCFMEWNNFVKDLNVNPINCPFLYRQLNIGIIGKTKLLIFV